jgi:integrase
MIDHITQSKIPKYQCPPDKKSLRVYQDDRSGLNLYVTRNGSRTWDFQFKSPVTKKSAHYKVGDADIVSVDEAKEAVVDLRRLVAKGIDPRDQKKESTTTPNLAQFMEEQYLPYVDLRKRSAKKDRQMYHDRLKKRFGDQQLNQIRRKEIQQFHTDLRNEGLAPATCDHYVKLLRHALYLAVDWEVIPRNPAARIPLFNVDNQINNVMDSNELGRFLSILQTDPNRPVCDVLLFTLSTAARIGSVLSARWADFDMEARVWRLDQASSKNKRTLYVPINNVALDILKRNQSDNEYVFVNKRTGTKYCTVTRVFHRLRKAAGLPRLRIHDLRHQAASIMVAEGQSLYTVSKVLSHADQRVSARYSHLQSDSLQVAAECVSDKITEVMKAASGEN